MNDVILKKNLTDNTESYEVNINQIDNPLLTMLDGKQEYKSITLNEVPTLQAFEQLINVLSAPFKLSIKNPLLISETLLAEINQLISMKFHINYTMMNAERMIYHIEKGIVDEDKNLAKIERSILIEHEIAAQRKAELKRIANLERDYKNNRASFLKHQRLYKDALVQIEQEQHKQSELQQHIQDLKDELLSSQSSKKALQEKYDALANSKLGSMQLKYWDRKRR